MKEAKYKSGSSCKKQKSCIWGCSNCTYMKKIGFERDYGECTNSESINYNQEVYDSACCTYICKEIGMIKIRIIKKDIE